MQYVVYRSLYVIAMITQCIVHFTVYLSSILFNNQNFRKRKCDSRDDKFCVLFSYNVYRPNIGLVFWCLCCIVVLIESAE